MFKTQFFVWFLSPGEGPHLLRVFLLLGGNPTYLEAGVLRADHTPARHPFDAHKQCIKRLRKQPMLGTSQHLHRQF